MPLFRNFLLFALVLAVLLTVPAGVVLRDVAGELRGSRTAEALLERLHAASDLLHAVHEEQVASLQQQDGIRPAVVSLTAVRARTDAALRDAAADGTLLRQLRYRVDGGAATPLELLHGYHTVAAAVVAEAEGGAAAAGLPAELAGPVNAWLLLLRGMDYAAHERDLTWLMQGTVLAGERQALFELCHLQVRLDELLQHQLARKLPPPLAQPVVALVQDDTGPVAQYCTLIDNGVRASLLPGLAPDGGRLEALAGIERQFMQWIAGRQEQHLIAAWGRGFLTVLAGSIVSLLLLAYGFYLARAYARPLDSLIHAARDLHDEAVVTVRAEVNGSGEMAALAAAFNELADARQEHEQYQRLADNVFEHALDGILVTDASGTIQAMNPALGGMMGYPGRALMYRNVRLLQSGRHDAAFYQSMWQTLSRAGAWRGEIWNRRGDGELALFRLSIAAVRDAAGAVLHYIGMYSDVTERHRAEQALRRSDDYNRTIIAALGEGLYCVDGEGFLKFLNPVAERMLGWREEELYGRNAHDAFHGKRADGSPLPRSECALLGVFHNGINYHGEEVFTRRDGSSFPVECHSTPLRESGEITGAVVAFTDISRRKEDEQRIQHLAYHDSLTGLANRGFLLEHLRLLISQGHRRPQSLAILFLDLDRFKQVNNTLGHHLGDRLLTEVATRLRSALREGDLLARQGGDEFIVVCAADGEADAEGDVATAALVIAANIHAALVRSFLIEGLELYVNVSIGISCLPQHGNDAHTLLRRAEQAMYQAKSAGVRTSLYAPGGDRFLQERLTLENRLRGALVRNDLRLLVQPVVELASGRIVAGEALLRWNDAGRSIAPERFIPVAEETGQIMAIGDWVNGEVCRLAAQWRRQAPDFLLAVNLSPRQLFGSGLLRSLCRAMDANGLGRDALELEITETVTMSLPRRARRTISWLRRRGVHLAIDDFGTGHSSLVRLQEITADRLKIDRSFVKGLPDTLHSVTIVRNTITLAHDLGMKVVAEGVETEAQRRLLLELGCDHAQGFLFSPAVEPQRFGRLLEQGVLVPELADSSCA